MNTITFPTAQHAVEKIAQEFVIYSQLNHPVHISLSGGSTPKLLFKTLAKAPYTEQINWKNLHFWWGDDRMVQPTNPESNYGEVQKLFIRSHSNSSRKISIEFVAKMNRTLN